MVWKSEFYINLLSQFQSAIGTSICAVIMFIPIQTSKHYKCHYSVLASTAARSQKNRGRTSLFGGWGALSSIINVGWEKWNLLQNLKRLTIEDSAAA